MADCSVDNIKQTLFLGCSVEKFSCSLGFNEQPTEVTVRLVRDTCASPEGTYKIWYDITSNNLAKQWTGPDPGLKCYGPNGDEPPNLGAPVYFRFGDFEFAGILQSYRKDNTRSDLDSYEVKILSPVEVLHGCQLILGDYSGPIKGFNIFNVYGFQEVFSANNPALNFETNIDGIVMGAYGGGFGGSEATAVGMSWNKIKQATNILTSAITPVNINSTYKKYSEFGRMVYYGGQANARFGLIPRHDVNLSLGITFGVSSELAYYILDISEIPNVPDDYRVAGPAISIMSLISQVCSDFGFDFYIELIPTRLGGTLFNIIKVRTISRAVQPNLGIVEDFISATDQVIDSSFGRELINENSTTFLVGGQKQNLVQIQNGLPNPNTDPDEFWLNQNFGNESSVRDMITPYFGMDQFRNPYVLHTEGIEHFQNFYINFSLVNMESFPILITIVKDTQLRNDLGLIDGKTIKVTIGEMRAACHGYDSWSSYNVSNGSELGLLLDAVGWEIDSITQFRDHLDNWLQQSNKWTYQTARDKVNIKKARRRSDFFTQQEIELNGIWDRLDSEIRAFVELLKGIYSNAKRTFMVRVPFVKAKWNADLTMICTDEPTEGGWTEEPYLGHRYVYSNADLIGQYYENIDIPTTSYFLSGISNPSTYADRLRLDNGLLKPFCIAGIPLDDFRFYQTYDSLRAFSDEINGFVFTENNAKTWYMGVSQGSDFVFLDRANLKSPRVLITLPTDLDFDAPDKNDVWEGTNPLAQDTKNGIESEVVKNNEFCSMIFEPDIVCVALKSNVYTYGPWRPDNIIQAGPPGQIKFEKQEDLVPWTFGSVENLELSAQNRVNNTITIMSQAEMGSITVHGAPTVPLGSELASLAGLSDNFYNGNTHLIENRFPTFASVGLSDINGSNKTFLIPQVNFGYWNGSYGPNVTSVNVEFGDNIQTTYSFRTSTPKWGVLGKLNASRIEQRMILENQRRAQIRYLQESKKLQNKFNQGFGGLAKLPQRDVLKTLGTPHSLLVGELNSWSQVIPSGTGENAVLGDNEYRRGIIATKSLFEIKNNLRESGAYNNKAIMSLDGLIRPVSMDGDGDLPRYINNSLTGYRSKTNTAAAIPPFVGYKTTESAGNSVYTGDITLDYLNPLSNPNGYYRSSLDFRHTGTSAHDIDIVARGVLGDFEDDGHSLTLAADITGYHNQSTRADYFDDYRFLALRGPLVMQSWGYDTDGKPVPNEKDSIAAITGSGIFKSTGLGDKFLSDFMRKSHTWPVAPIDLRLDRKRNVWTAPPPYDFVICTIQEAIEPYGSGQASFIPQGAYSSNGSVINIGKIDVVDKIGASYSTGTKVYAYYDTKNSQYNIIGGAGGAGGSSTPVDIKIALIDKDIEGVYFDDPVGTMTTGDVAVTAEEQEAGIRIIFQNPATGDIDLYNYDFLNVFPYERRQLKLKYFYEPTKTVIADGITTSGGNSNWVQLDEFAGSQDNMYKNMWLRTYDLEEDDDPYQLQKIVSYSGATKIAYVTTSFNPPLHTGTMWEISQRDFGYREVSGVALKRHLLKTEIEDIPGTTGDPLTRVVRYATIDVNYDDREGFKVGEYKRTDYPDYDDFADWPPTGLPTGFLNRKWQAIIINNVFDVRLCKVLPPPPLPTTGD